MYPGFKFTILAVCLFVSSIASVAKAQLASDKSFKEIYNKRISERLTGKNKSISFSGPGQKEQNLPGSRASLKDLAKLTIKKPAQTPGFNAAESNEDKKNKLPSNSPSLKQMGFRTAKMAKSTIH